MMEYRAKYRGQGDDPARNRRKWLLLIREEGIKVADLKEKNEKLPLFGLPGFPFSMLCQARIDVRGVARWIRSFT